MPKYGIAITLIILAALLFLSDDIRSDWLGFNSSPVNLSGAW
jgi:hypothetical protein